jgi:hypothetical protein
VSVLIIDSDFASLREAIQNPPIPIPWKVKRTLVLLTVYYYSFDGRVHQGQIVVHKTLKAEVREIFARLLAMRFPIKKVIPISKYDWNDGASMADNNSSAFNYRPIERRPEDLSPHAYAWALDLNPRLNPFVDEKGTILPEGATYDFSVPGTIIPDGPVVQLFIEYGWVWGGHWINVKDYQHFQKVLS